MLFVLPSGGSSLGGLGMGGWSRGGGSRKQKEPMLPSKSQGDFSRCLELPGHEC